MLIKTAVMDTAVAFVTDGDIGQLLGVMLLAQHFQGMDLTDSSYTLWVGAPPHRMDLVRDILTDALPGVGLNFWKTPYSPDDQYYIKLGIADLARITDGDANILYLDYDNLPLSRFTALPQINFGKALMSSEVHPMPSNVQSAISNIFHIGGLNLHLNSSMILIKSADLASMSELWAYAYSRLFGTIGTRFLEEISYTIAAHMAGISLAPCSLAFQSSFQQPFIGSSFFHFGGTTHDAAVWKRRLRSYGEMLASKRYSLAPLQSCKEELTACFRNLTEMAT